MIFVTGTVASASCDRVTILVDRQSGCGACTTAAGCGLGPLLELFARGSSRLLDVSSRDGYIFASGDRVRIALRGRRLAALGMVAYATPLFGLFAGAGIAAIVAPTGGDAAAVIGALTGVMLAWVLLRLLGLGRFVSGSLRAVVGPA